MNSQTGDLDILMNNAGSIQGDLASSIEIEDWLSSWSLKVVGYIHLCQLFFTRNEKRNMGTITNIIGMGGRVVSPNYICGAGANSALIGFTSALGAESSYNKLRVPGINPSLTFTELTETLLKGRAFEESDDPNRWREFLNPSQMPFGRVNFPHEVGDLAAILCSEKKHNIFLEL